ncbi:MAG: peptidylprolyl isomerase [Planctomycetota bacterium]
MTQDVVLARSGKFWRRLSIVAGGCSILVLFVVARYYWSAEEASAQSPRTQQVVRPSATHTPRGVIPASATVPMTTARAAAARPAPQAAQASPAATEQMTVVARVNNEDITRDALGEECLRHYGTDVLESLINKYLIVEECKRRNVAVTRGEVDAEVERMAKRFKLSVDQWMTMLAQERGITPIQYASDIIWPTLALRKLAGERLQVTPDELKQAYETHYGAMIRCRLIACKDKAKAEQVRQLAAADPAKFGDLAKEHSEDPSAGVKGLIQPIRRHGTFKELEEAAFSMQDGEVSSVIAVADQHVIIKREGQIEGPSSVRFDVVAPQLEEIVRERKMRDVAAEIFQQLQQGAKVVNVLNNPVLSRQMPGVAATINGVPIPLSDLAAHCIERHGEEVLDGAINRKLLEQACRSRNIQVTEEDMDEEIARAAAALVPPKADGSPDVEAWIKTVTEEQGITEEIYRADAVWPSVALRKLAIGDVQVTDEDLTRGFEANYGPRVRCRAIVLNNARRAQEVWEMARKKLTVENFGMLAEQYSVEPGSQSLRGEIPPIKRWGGQPVLEEAAFALKTGELSEIVQVTDKYVILLCEGFTEPVDVTFDQVRDEIKHDIFEKKLRLAMAEHFARIQESATIDNYLAGEVQSPQKPGEPSARAPSIPTLRQVGRDEVPAPRVLTGARPQPTAVQ